MIPARHELKLIRGGKPPAFLGLPCDSCDRRHGAPRECIEECAFLAPRQRIVEERRKTKKQRRTTKQETIH